MVLAAALFALAAFVLFTRWRSWQRRRTVGGVERDSTPAVDAWLEGALESELEGALGLRGASAHERAPLTNTLRGAPDPDVVSRIEDAVKAIDLEYVCYAHETTVEATVFVRFQDGKTGHHTRRLALADVPESVRADFQQKGATRSFRRWTFPWQRVSTL